MKKYKTMDYVEGVGTGQEIYAEESLHASGPTRILRAFSVCVATELD